MRSVVKEKPSGSARLDLLVTALQMGQFEKNSEVYSYEGCALCDKKFKTDGEVVFHYPKQFMLQGTDLPFDIKIEHSKMCLPCLLELHKALPNSEKSLQDIVEYAKGRYEKDKDKVYIPQAIAPEEPKK